MRSSKKRILVNLIAYTERKGGTDDYTRSLYREIGQLKSDFEFIGLASREARSLDMSWFPGEVNYSPMSGNIRVQWALNEIWQVSRASKRFNPSAIHCPANYGPIFGSTPVVLTLHDVLYWSHPELAPNRKLVLGVKLLQWLAAKHATRIMTDSKYSATQMEKYLTVKSQKIRVVYLGADSFNEREENLRDSFIIAGGNRFRHKNWENLLKGLRIVPESKRPKLVITGGNSQDPLDSLIKELDLSSSVTLTKWLHPDELENLNRKARAVVVPSLVAGFSLPLLQAMKEGKVVLASQIPVHEEIAQEAAIYFDPHSPNSIAEAILTYSSNPDFAYNKAKLGREIVRDFSWRKCALESLEVIASVMDEKSNPNAVKKSNS